jgi:hypothetical protein
MFTGLLKAAIASGEMKPVSDFVCVDCEKPATAYDHRDYRKLLDVQPVCRTCNYKRGPAAWREEASIAA